QLTLGVSARLGDVEEEVLLLVEGVEQVRRVHNGGLREAARHDDRRHLIHLDADRELPIDLLQLEERLARPFLEEVGQNLLQVLWGPRSALVPPLLLSKVEEEVGTAQAQGEDASVNPGHLG